MKDERKKIEKNDKNEIKTEESKSDSIQNIIQNIDEINLYESKTENDIIENKSNLFSLSSLDKDYKLNNTINIGSQEEKKEFLDTKNKNYDDEFNPSEGIFDLYDYKCQKDVELSNDNCNRLQEYFQYLEEKNKV